MHDCIVWNNKFLLSSTHHDHLGGLEDEAFVGSPGAATRPLAKAAEQKMTWFKIRSRQSCLEKLFFEIQVKNFYVGNDIFFLFYLEEIIIVGEEVGYFSLDPSSLIYLLFF